MVDKKKKVSVLFVCLGNICRSPAGEAVLRSLVEKRGLSDSILIESCGIGGWHIGQPADKRMKEAGARRNFFLGGVAQQFDASFFDRFDFIMAADHEVYEDLHALAEENTEHGSRIHLITAFSACYQDEEVPDPYYSGTESFELVLDMVEDSCDGLLDHIVKTSL